MFAIINYKIKMLSAQGVPAMAEEEEDT